MYFNEDQIKYFGVDYEADESEYWRNNNDYVEPDEHDELKDEQGLLYDEWLKIQRQVETIYDLYPLNAKEEEALNVLLKRQFEIETKLDEIEIKLRAE